MKLGIVLKEYRYAKRISVRTLAKEIKISGATLNRLENGHTHSDIETFRRIFDWLLKGGESNDLKRSGRNRADLPKQIKSG